MSYNYTSFQQALALFMAIPNADITTPNFVAALPSIIDYAEQRCYRELDLLAARQTYYGTLTPNSPFFNFSAITYPPQPAPVVGPFLANAAAFFDPPATGIAMLSSADPIVAGMTVLDVTTGILLGTLASYGPLTAAQTASAAWALGDVDILLQVANLSLVPGMTVFDQTTSTLIGTISTIEHGNAITLTAGALAASSGAADVLTISSGSNNVAIFQSAILGAASGNNDLLQFSSPANPIVNPQPLPTTVERLRVLLPVGVPIPPATGQVTSSVPCVPVSQEYLDAVFGPGSSTGVPVYFAHPTQSSIELGPPPDQAYVISLFGMYRPVPLYLALPTDGTQTTFLSVNLPDLFLAAAMISASGYQKNFGAQMDDPKMAQSWETQYNLLLPSAKSEEMRKRFHGWMANTAESNPPPTPQPVPGG